LARGGALPSITVIVPAYNESGIILEKLENTLALEYPREMIEIIVASDGSTDGTNELVEAFGNGIRLLALPRSGKNRALTLAGEVATGEILVFTDADTKLTARTLLYLAEAFADSEVGGVAGERRHGSQSSRPHVSERGKRLLREMMSRAGSVTSAEGQIYAVRRELFEPVPENVPDDFWISTRIVAQHRRLVYQPHAASYPFAGATVVRNPFERKVRMIGPLYRAFWLGRDLLNPGEHGFYSILLLAHKALRRLVFVPVVGLALTAPALSRNGRAYRIVALCEGLLHGAALAAYVLRGSRFARKGPLKAALRFEESCAASAVALGAQILGRRPRDDTWEPQRADPDLDVRRGAGRHERSA